MTRKRKQTVTRNEFTHTPMDMLVATGLFMTEVWTWGELVTYDG